MKKSLLLFLLLMVCDFTNAQNLKPYYLKQPDFLHPLFYEWKKQEFSVFSIDGFSSWHDFDMFKWKLVTIYLDSIQNGNFIQYISTGKKRWIAVEYFNNKIVSYGELISKVKSELSNDTIMVTYAEPPYLERPQIYLWQKTIKNGKWTYYSKDTYKFRLEEVYKDGVLISKRSKDDF